MVTSRIIGKFSYPLEELAGVDVLAVPPTLLDDTIETISTVKPRGRRERRWSQEQIYKAAKVLQDGYDVEGLDEWNSNTL